MKPLLVLCAAICVSICQGNEQSTVRTTTTSKPQITEEDLRVVNETITRYGPVQNYKDLGLPGTELLTNRDASLIENIIDYDANNTLIYTIKTRAITPLFNYNRRYEVGTVSDEAIEVPVVKGQFGEHFERKSGGYYVRTIGYVLDENGYREFLIDISTAQAKKTNKRISSAALASLTGGGLG